MRLATGTIPSHRCPDRKPGRRHASERDDLPVDEMVHRASSGLPSSMSVDVIRPQPAASMLLDLGIVETLVSRVINGTNQGLNPSSGKASESRRTNSVTPSGIARSGMTLT